MAKKTTIGSIGANKSPATTIVESKPVAAVAETKPRTNIFQFFREVRVEARKIVWPSRKETWITTVMVLIMVVVATLFFAAVDFGFGALSHFIIKA